MENSPNPQPVLVKRRRKKKTATWLIAMVTTLVVWLAIWQVGRAVQAGSRPSHGEDKLNAAVAATPLLPPPQVKLGEAVQQPAATLVTTLPGSVMLATASRVTANGKPMEPNESQALIKAQAEALAEKMKTRQAELKGEAASRMEEMKKKSDEAMQAAEEATAKDIGVRSQVLADFRAVTAVLNKYFTATSEVEIEALVRHPDLVMPKYKEWAARGRNLEPARELHPSTKFITTDRFFITAVPVANGTSRMAVFEKAGKSFKLDWESLVGWCEQPFEDLPRLASGQQTLLRVYARRSSATPPFKVVPGGVSFTLTHPDEPMTLNAFMPAEVASGGGKSARYLMGMERSGMVTLKVFMDDECRRHGWVKIASIRRMGWVADVDMQTTSALLGK